MSYLSGTYDLQKYSHKKTKLRLVLSIKEKRKSTKGILTTDA